MRGWIVAFALALVLVWPARASAQESDAAAAEALFQKGREAMSAEDYDAACQFFLESLALDQAVGTVMNLATCEEKRGHLTSSWERWHQALRMLDPLDDRVLFAEDELTSISARLAQLTIRLTGASASEVTIRRDGVVLGAASLGQQLPADPGTHVVTVDSERFESKRYTLTLESGEQSLLVVSPGPRKPPADEGSSDTSVMARRIGAFAAYGIAAAGITTAIVSGVLLPGKDRKIEQNCPDQMCNEVGLKTISEAQTLLALNTAGFIAAGVGLAGGTVLLLTLPRGKKETPERKASSSPKSPSPSPAKKPPATADGRRSAALALSPTGIWLSGTF